jgi:hypothetical protein
MNVLLDIAPDELLQSLRQTDNRLTFVSLYLALT